MHPIDPSHDPSRSPKVLRPSVPSLGFQAGTVVLFVAALWAASDPLAALAVLAAVVVAGVAAVGLYHHLDRDAGASRCSEASGRCSDGSDQCPEASARAD